MRMFCKIKWTVFINTMVVPYFPLIHSYCSLYLYTNLLFDVFFQVKYSWEPNNEEHKLFLKGWICIATLLIVLFSYIYGYNVENKIK